MTVDIRLEARGLTKQFNRRVIFQNLAFSIAGGQVLLVTGKNGSGKSTLVKILCGVLSPGGGTVAISANGVLLDDQLRRDVIGMVSPYLQLYEEFSARENLAFAFTLRGRAAEAGRITALLERVGLSPGRPDPLRTYSSGMKQRAKLAFALAHGPAILVLDEPMANLDAEGIAMARQVMEDHRREGILVVATNDLTDVERYDLEVQLHGSR